MEAELKANYPDSNVKLIDSGGGVFDVKCNGKLIYSKQNIEGQRFPDEGEITKLIEQAMNHHATGISTFTKSTIILGHALIGWIYCGALIGIGRQFMSMQATLVMHAIGAPLGFILISLHYFKRFAFTSPLQTAFLFLSVVIAMDIFVVAILIEKSFAMFASPLGTWLPLALIFSATYMTGIICKHGEKH